MALFLLSVMSEKNRFFASLMKLSSGCLFEFEYTILQRKDERSTIHLSQLYYLVFYHQSFQPQTCPLTESLFQC